MKILSIFGRRLAFTLCLGLSCAWSQVAVLTHHNDNNRSGANLNEVLLNTSNVNVNQFAALFAVPVDGQIYAQPLYVSSVTIPSAGTHNVVYVGTENNSVYAFDADSAGPPLWQRTLGTASNCYPTVQNPTVYTQCTASISSWYNMFPLVGITATPVIDPATGTMYLTNVSVENALQVHYLHALDIASGAEKFGGPVVIQGSVPGTGDGSTSVIYNTTHERMRTAITLVNGLLVWAAGAYSDWQPYHGWVFVYDAKTLQQKGIWASTPNGYEGGIWQSGSGAVADDGGNVYFETGNGSFDGISNFGMSFIKLNPSANGLSVLDYFAPYNEYSLSQQDMDLGSAGPMRILGTNYLVGGGKTGILYLLNLSSLGGFNSVADQVVQEFQATTGPPPYPSHIHAAPVYWNSRLYLWGESTFLKAFQFNGASFQTTPVSQSTITSPATGPMVCNSPTGRQSECMPGGFLSISANGTTPGTGIVWANTAYSGSAENAIQPGILHAIDASDLTHELWNSRQNAARDDFGLFAKFVPPTVANGKVYMATFSNKLVVYGLLPDAQPPTPPTNLLATSNTSSSVTLSWTASTDNVGVTGYNIFRNGTRVGTSISVGFQDPGVSPNTNYSYWVVAYDGAGNSSAPSSTLNLSTPRVNTAPTATSVSPNSGTGLSQVFTAVFTDPNGFQVISQAYVNLNSVPSPSYGCAVLYDSTANVFHLLNDAGTGLISGGLTPGSPAQLSNSQCILSGSGSIASGSGNNLTVVMNLTLNPVFGGLKNIYGRAQDSSGLKSSWQPLGTWLRAANQPPVAVSVSPSSGAGVTQTFSLVYSDPDGYLDLIRASVLVNSQLRPASACIVTYRRAGNLLFLSNDAGSGTVGSIAPGSTMSVSNSQCTLGSAGPVIAAGTNITVPITLTFASGFSGNRNVYMQAVDNSLAASAWVLSGTWSVP